MNKTFSLLHSTAMLVALIGIILHILGVEIGYIILGIGACLLLFTRLFAHAKIEDKTMRRQIMILAFGAVFLISASYLIYLGKRYWLIPLIADALIELYISFRISNKF